MQYNKLPSPNTITRFNRLHLNDEVAVVVGFSYWGRQKRKKANSRDSYNTYLFLRDQRSDDKVLELGLHQSRYINKCLKVVLKFLLKGSGTSFFDISRLFNFFSSYHVEKYAKKTSKKFTKSVVAVSCDELLYKSP